MPNEALDPRREPFVALAAATAVVLLSGSIMYVQVMCDGTWNSHCLIEAANYATQTITTVGYGNWTHGLNEEDSRILWMKAASVPFMLIGALIFGIFVASVVKLYPGE